MVAPVRISGTASPSSKLVVNGHCARFHCDAQVTSGEDGSWSAVVRLVLSRETPLKTLTANYSSSPDINKGAARSIRIREPSSMQEARLAAQASTTTITGPSTTDPAAQADPTFDQSGSATGADPSAAEPNALALGGNMLLIGDSLAQSIAPLLPAALPDWSLQINARVGRRLAEGMAILSATEIPDATVLAISLFTNDDPWNTAQLKTGIEATLARVGTTGCAVWATIAAPPVNGHTYQVANQLLDSLSEQYSQLLIVPWAQKIAQTPSLLSSDGVHPTSAGKRLRTEMYAEAAQLCLS
ncbi:MAG: hypothetical protein NTV40_09350 [Solirubrobacterales bacterium]|nr:hypothetical protein [Solirubrobacterales bacterium]